MGRKAKPYGKKKRVVNVSLRPDTFELLDKIVKHRECTMTWVVQKCLDMTLKETVFMGQILNLENDEKY